MDEEKKKTMQVYYQSWVAPGKGFAKAGGQMYMQLENVEGDKWKAVGYTDSTSTATGESCSAFSDEERYFDSVYDGIKDLEFFIDDNALELCKQLGRVKEAAHFMQEYGLSSMRLANIDGEFGVIYNSHKGMQKDSPDSALYTDSYGFIRPDTNISLCEMGYERDVKNMNGELVHLSDIHFPSEMVFNRFSIVYNKEKYPESLQQVKPDNIFLGKNVDLPEKLSAKNLVISDHNEVKVTSSWNVDKLNLEKCKNVQILGGNIKDLQIRESGNVVISNKVQIDKMIVSDVNNILVPITAGEVFQFKSRVYLYDKHPDDKVLWDNESKEKVKKYVGQHKQMMNFYKSEIENEQNSVKTRERYKSGLEREYKEQRILESTDIQNIYEKPEEDNSNKSLKEIYKEIKKKSGVVRADLLAAAAIVKNIDRI